MEELKKCKIPVSLWMWVPVAGLLLSLNLVMATTITFEDQKNYYSPEPHPRSPPSSRRSPPHHTTPSTPPHHGGYSPPSTPTPTPPSGGNCDTPPSTPTPTVPYTPTPTPTPSTPTPSTPSNPPSGGYYPTPPTTGGTPPTTGGTPPTTGGTPPTTGGTPPTPVIVSPPTTPTVPTPYTPDPNSPFSCNYWNNHPGLIWGILGWWGTLGSAFGVTNCPGVGATMSVQQALSNTRTDGYGALYREGTASLLNSMINNRFPFTTRQVRESFVAALNSNKAAAAQGHLFKLANEGKLKPRN